MNATGIILERFKQSRIAATIPTPLATYLYIYNHSWYESYIDYMKGAKALAKYLTPIDIKEINIEIPAMLVSYDLQELAKLLQPHTTISLEAYQIENAIYEHLTKSR